VRRRPEESLNARASPGAAPDLGIERLQARLTRLKHAF
jgi:hypothetical protein